MGVAARRSSTSRKSPSPRAPKYMSRMLRRFDPSLPAAQRWHFALASYNAGYGHVLDARALAPSIDKNHEEWLAHVDEAIVLLENPEYSEKARYGYCRGSEPQTYVAQHPELLRGLQRLGSRRGDREAGPMSRLADGRDTPPPSPGRRCHGRLPNARRWRPRCATAGHRDPSKWDRRFWNVQITDADARGMTLRVLCTAADASRAWDLRCDVREALIAWLNANHSDCLPRVRAELEKEDGDGSATARLS